MIAMCIAAVILVSSSPKSPSGISSERTSCGPWGACAARRARLAGERAATAGRFVDGLCRPSNTKHGQGTGRPNAGAGQLFENQAGNAYLVTDEPRTHSRRAPSQVGYCRLRCYRDTKRSPYYPHDSPHSQMAPNMCAKRGWAASIWTNRLMSGGRRKSVVFGMSS